MIFNNKFSNILYIKKHKILYVATPKAACTSLKLFFANTLGLKIEKHISLHASPELAIHDFLIYKNFSLFFILYKSFLNLNKQRDIKTFCIVRNPYTRIFSAWQNKILEGDQNYISKYSFLDKNLKINSKKTIQNAFEDFLIYLDKNIVNIENFDNHWRPQSIFLDIKNVRYDFIGKVEEFDAIKKFLGNQLNMKTINIPRVNETHLKFDHSFISPLAKKLILKIFPEDFKNFNYPKEPPKSKLANGEIKVSSEKIFLLREKNQRIADMMTFSGGIQIFAKLIILRAKQFFSTRKI